VIVCSESRFPPSISRRYHIIEKRYSTEIQQVKITKEVTYYQSIATTMCAPTESAKEETPSTGSSGCCVNLNRYNWINLLAYAVNVLVTFGIGLFGWTGTPDNGTLSARYETIVTPSGTAFSIWSLIFLAQGIWVVWQFVVPSARANKLIVHAVGYKHAILVAFQSGWTFAFGYEVMWLSLVCMYGLLACLVWTIQSLQHYYKKDWKQYAIYQFPFSLHCGWIMAAAAVNTNALVVFYARENVTVQIVVAAATLVALLVGAMFFLNQYPADLAIPLVLVWALGWVYDKLSDPVETIVDRFTMEQIEGFKWGALAGAALILASTVLKALYVLCFALPRERRERQQQIEKASASVPADHNV